MQRQRYPYPWEWRTITAHGPSPARPVVVPHDAVLGVERVDDPALTATGYVPGGTWEYRSRFEAPPDWQQRHVVLELEAVYRSPAVSLNGDLLARRPSGTAALTVPLDGALRYGAPNELTVEARADRDARWYTGGGILRPVHLAVGPRVHVPLDGVVVTVPESDDETALVQVVTTVRNLEPRPAMRRLRTTVVGPDGEVVAADTTRVTVPANESREVSQRMLVAEPRRWSPAHPDLHTVESVLATDTGDEVDERRVVVGIRTLQLDARRGLRIDGVPVDLRGACVHADNGVIGGVVLDDAEERRVTILKEAGFNAIRSAHQPMSRAMLDACDRLGMLVMDELTDVWTRAKRPEDGSSTFTEWWQRDLEDMVRKDRNHPSVIMYSIGNEIPEAGTRTGAELSRRLAARTRRLDPTRYVTAGVNGALLVMDGAVPVDPELLGGASLEEVEEINGFMMQLADRMNALGVSDAVTALTEEAYGALDVAGMNYLESRYEHDRTAFPHRVIVGSETFPTRIDVLWNLVRSLPHVIGDFTWTGWDYLGEPGLGRPRYRDEPPGTPPLAPYPWLLSGAGDIDITGERRPASYYREIVYGLRREPFLAVRRPEIYGREAAPAPWSWTDCLPSWTWPVAPGTPLEVEVYADAPEVEVLLGGRTLGRYPTGPEHRYRALVEVGYQPGAIEAVAIRDGVPAERARLVTASGPRGLRVHPDRTRLDGPDALAFLTIEVTDDEGVRATDADDEVTLRVEGPAALQGFGSAAPRTLESFTDDRHRLFDGRALAVVRAGGSGDVRVVASAPGYAEVSTELRATGV